MEADSSPVSGVADLEILIRCEYGNENSKRDTIDNMYLHDLDGCNVAGCRQRTI